MPDTAILIRASITFQTNGDDKDSDTGLIVTVKLIDGTPIAGIDNNFGNFKNNTESGPYDLQIASPSTKGELKTGSVHIRIQPSGDDTWRFNFFLDLYFEDRTHLIARANGLHLTESPPQQEQSFGIE